MKRIFLTLPFAVFLFLSAMDCSVSAPQAGSKAADFDEPGSIGTVPYEGMGIVQSVNRAAGYVRIDGKTYMLSMRTVISAQDRRLATLEKAKGWVGRKAAYNADGMGNGEYVLTGIHILGK